MTHADTASLIAQIRAKDAALRAARSFLATHLDPRGDLLTMIDAALALNAVGQVGRPQV